MARAANGIPYPEAGGAVAAPGAGPGGRRGVETISIGLGESPTEFLNELDAALRPLQARGARLEIREARRGPLVFLGCHLEPAAGAAAVGTDFRQAVAQALARWIVERRERALLQRLIGTHYAYFTADERENILSLAVRQLGSGAGAEGVQGRRPPAPAGELAERAPSPAAVRRRARVLQRVVEYLERQDTLVVDGFVTFRLKDYVDELVTAVDRAVDDFLMEREYREFVGLLRHVVDSQLERPPVTHCVFDGSGGFQLQDEQGQAVAADFLDEVGPEAALRDVGVEDLLVSALITVAPRAVRLHVPEEAAVALSQDALGTLEAVFPRAVSVCPGCARCGRRAQG